jgi:lipopolysaccharide heptosyltransferase II
MKVVCFHLNQIGDLAFSLPALKCIRDGMQDAHITSLVRPGAVELIRATGLVDEVIPRPGGFGARKIALGLGLAAHHFDAAIVFSQSGECALLSWLSRTPRRIGFENTTFGSLLTDRLPFKHPPSTENNQRLIEALGCPIISHDYVGLLKSSVDMQDRANGILARHGIAPEDRLVAFSPGTSGRRRLKLWTDSGFAEVGRDLTARGVRVVVLGTTPVTGIAQDCAEIIDLSGQTDLGAVAGILARCETLVAVDSGIMHLAAALGKRVVGLFGPSDPSITGPQGEGHEVVTSGADCAPCNQGECKFDRKCMTELDASMVIGAVDRILCAKQLGKTGAADQS